MHIEALLPAMAASQAGPSGDVHDEARWSAVAVTQALRDLISCSGFALSAWDATSGTHRHVTLASDGYDSRVLDHMNDGFVESNPAFEILHTRTPGVLRWRDLAREWNLSFAETRSAQEFLIPAGFREGSTVCLRLQDGRYTGSLHVSWASPGAAIDRHLELIESFSPMLAVVCDTLRSAQIYAERLDADTHAVLLSADGQITAMPGRPAGSALSEPALLARLPRETPERAGRRGYLWADPDGRCHRIQMTPCRGDVTLVTERTVPWPFGLTFRETQVLHLIAEGFSNPEIAPRLFISPRTVSTHIEHLLDKLGCRSRARLAAIAVANELLLIGGAP